MRRFAGQISSRHDSSRGGILLIEEDSSEMAQKLPSLLEDMCTVRPPRPNDYDKIADLAGQLGYESTEKEIRDRLGEMQDSNQYAVYVAELPGGRIAGWIGVYVFRSVETDRCAEISGLVVDQQIRSRGIGKVLLHNAEKWARIHGCDVISVRSNVTRGRAHSFYKENGYERTKTQESFRKIL
jgi:GNAT superfamily N-acetyltransferase